MIIDDIMLPIEQTYRASRGLKPMPYKANEIDDECLTAEEERKVDAVEKRLKLDPDYRHLTPAELRGVALDHVLNDGE